MPDREFDKADVIEEARLAKAGVIDHAMCEECEESYIFEMEKGGDRFAVGLTTVLACLAFAEENHCVPPLGDDWWVRIRRRYR